MTELELLTATHNLPDDIREHLSSARTLSFMIGLSARLNIKGERQRIIPGLVRRLLARDLMPQDFLSELAIQLNISDSSAKIIVKEIEENVLHSIEDSLRDKADIDVALLHFGKEVSGELPKVADVSVAEPAAPALVIKPKPVIDTERHIEAKIMPPAAKPAAPSGPFMLHSEKDEIKPVAEAQRSRPTFSIKIPITQKKYYSSAPMVKARIETPPDDVVKGDNVPPRQARGINVPTQSTQPPLRKLSEMAMATPEDAGIIDNANDVLIMNNKLEIMEGGAQRDSSLTQRMTKEEPSARATPAQPPLNKKIQIENGAVKMAPPKIQKVVHYSDFFTQL